MIKIPKLFNFRFFLTGFALFVLGIFVALSFFVSYWFLVAFFILLAAAVVVVVTQKWYVKIRPYVVRTCALCFCFVLGMLSFSIAEGVYQSKLAPEGFYYVSARVTEVYETQENQQQYKTILDSVTLKTEDGKTKKLMGEATIILDQKVNVGDKITFSAAYKPNEHFPSTKNLSYSNSGMLYLYNNVEAGGTSLKVSDKLKNEVWKLLENNVDRNQAGTLFAMVFGDKTKIMESTKGEYMSSGVGHILAVSGLHVGFFVFLFSLLFDALKVNKKVKFGILSVALLLYSWLCGFSYSVLRASVMCIVSLYAGLRGRQYDGLSALCFSSILILTFNPFQLFSASFLLSFFAVFAIFCLQRVLKDFFTPAYPKKFSSSLALSFAVSIGIFPWMSYFFGYVTPYSFLLNIIIIPVASVAYMLCFAIIIFALPFNVFGVLLHAPEYLMKGIDLVCKFANELPYSNIPVQIHTATIVLWFLAIAVSCDYCLIKKKPKQIASISIWSVAVLLAILNVAKVF